MREMRVCWKKTLDVHKTLLLQKIWMDAVRHANIDSKIAFDSMDVENEARDNVDNLEMYVDM